MSEKANNMPEGKSRGSHSQSALCNEGFHGYVAEWRMMMMEERRGCATDTEAGVENTEQHSDDLLSLVCAARLRWPHAAIDEEVHWVKIEERRAAMEDENRVGLRSTDFNTGASHECII